SARAIIVAARTAAGITPATPVDDPSTPDVDESRLALFKNLDDLGGRREEARRDTIRFVIGATGKLSSEWSYEASVNWGKFKEDTKVLGNLNKQRFVLAMDAVRDTSGNIVCNAKINPSAGSAVPYDDTQPYSVNSLPGDIAACVPLNPFGQGNI